MNISFTDFWPGFQPKNNFFTHILQSISNKIVIVPFGRDTDILIYSCFGSQHNTANRNKIKKIFYTGESIRPNFNECDYSWTFDFDTHNGKNIRIPLWLLYIDFFNQHTYSNPSYLIPLHCFTNNNPYLSIPKTEFCCIINNHLANKRDEIYNELSHYKPVHGAGRAFNNSIPDGEDNKLKFLSNYRFNICFENKLYPGYYTEKLLHAKVGGCIPLYYSDLLFEKDFNPLCSINLSNFKNIEECVNHTITINENENLYKEMLQQPLFTTPDAPLNLLETIQEQIKNIL